MSLSIDDDDDVLVATAVAEPADPRYAAAAEILERAVQSGFTDPNVLYLLALAYKRQHKIAEARAALRKITKPDANVLLQMGTLSLTEQNLAQAEGEFQRARDMDPTSYEIASNLLLTQLSLGKINDALNDLPRLIELVTPKPGQPAAACPLRRPPEQPGGPRGVLRGGAGQGEGADRPLPLDGSDPAAAAAGPGEAHQPQEPGGAPQPARLLLVTDARRGSGHQLL
jgi:tetratricopeptide (TPR) repeat protein